MDRSKPAKRKVLIIEDDAALAEILVYNLAREGYDAQCVGDGISGLEAARRVRPDIVILDLMLPGINGIDVCKQLRGSTHGAAIPVLMLTAKSEEVDEVEGFSVGADDYVTKPFSVKVLLQRVRALLQRARAADPAAPLLELHGIAVDLVGHEVSCDGKVISVTPTEFRLLVALMRRPGRAFSRLDLVEAAIGDDTIVLERTIDVHIRALRHKLGRCAQAIETVRGVGYRFARDAAAITGNP